MLTLTGKLTEANTRIDGLDLGKDGGQRTRDLRPAVAAGDVEIFAAADAGHALEQRRHAWPLTGGSPVDVHGVGDDTLRGLFHEPGPFVGPNVLPIHPESGSAVGTCDASGRGRKPELVEGWVLSEFGSCTGPLLM